jgi:hypothetical protein
MSFKLFTINIKQSSGLLESGGTFGKFLGFGNLSRFWKPTGILETYGGFGNLRGFWKPMEVLETYWGFG